MNRSDLTERLREKATQLGFCSVGFCAAVEPAGFGRLQAWLDAGYAGQLQYMVDRRDAYRHPRHVLDGARSLVVLGTDYRNVEPEVARKTRGRISRYAWGADYHEVIRRRLRALADYHRELTPQAAVRGVVDTAPLLEREAAVLAGLGWIGKNTLLLTEDRGSWLFLSVLLTSEQLEYSQPYGQNHCGACRACLDACPTGALVEPCVLDARKCISYLTVELRGSVPRELRPRIGPWWFGCDVCQEVCPWNRRLPTRPAGCLQDEAFRPAGGIASVELAEVFALSDADFRSRFRKTALWRAKRRGLLRNAAIVLGNRPTEAAIPALTLGLNDAEALVRGACAWALGQSAAARATAELRKRLAVEKDPAVGEEIGQALRSC